MENPFNLGDVGLGAPPRGPLKKSPQPLLYCRRAPMTNMENQKWFCKDSV